MEPQACRHAWNTAVLQTKHREPKYREMHQTSRACGIRRWLLSRTNKQKSHRLLIPLLLIRFSSFKIHLIRGDFSILLLLFFIFDLGQGMKFPHIHSIPLVLCTNSLLQISQTMKPSRKTTHDTNAVNVKLHVEFQVCL